jgi:Na+:H+ antiporter, NhaC family
LEILLVFILFFSALLLAVTHNITLVCPLAFGLVCFVLLALRQGHPFSSVTRMMLNGVDRSLIVIKIFIFIGAITAVWRACGTVSFIVYYGISMIHPQFFILSAFVLCCLVSFLLGTSFGTVGTIGIIMMILAKTGGVDVGITAGAIIAGAYFGDRCSPMSSSASLVATLTQTELYTNVRNMFASSWLPLALSVGCYALLSPFHPLNNIDYLMTAEIRKSFNLAPLVVLPALLILILAAFRVNVKQSMGASILAGMIIGVLVQHHSALDMLRYLILGYHTEDSGFFAGIIQGGGLISMLDVSLIVLLSSAYAGIFSETDLLKNIEAVFDSFSQRFGLYASTLAVSILTAAFGCNQTMAVILTQQFQGKAYEKQQVSPYRLALDMENTVILISALIPWNIAGALPVAALSADAGFLPYAFYIWLVPLIYWFTRRQTSGPRTTNPRRGLRQWDELATQSKVLTTKDCRSKWGG